MTVLPRRPDGTLLLPGAIRHDIEYDFGWASAIPSDLTTGGGSAATIVGGNGTGRLSLTTGTSGASPSSVAIGKPVDMTACESAVFTLHGLSYPGADWPDQAFIGLEGGSISGASWRASEQVLASRNAGSSAWVTAPLPLGISGRATNVTLSLAILRRNKIAVLMLGDQIIQAAAMGSLDFATPLTPKATFRSDTSAAKVVTISKLSLSVRTN